MMGTMQEWRPQPGMTDHAGNLLLEDRFFFAPPPMEIGAIDTAYSNVLRSRETNPISKRLAITAGVTAIVLILVWVFLNAGSASGDMAMWMAVWGIPTAIVTFFVTNKKLLCTYVGQYGIARFYLKKDPEKTQQGEVFLFQYAAELRTSQTRNYTNGVYTGTNYTYKWSDFNGKALCTLSGSYHSAKGTPRIGDAYYYARAGENAWSAFAFERAKLELSHNGAVRFNLLGGNFLVIGSGFIDICIKGQTARCSTHEIARITIQQGVITLRRTDAKSGFFGIGSSGIFSFNYSELGNARLFCFLLDHLVGVDFS